MAFKGYTSVARVADRFADDLTAAQVALIPDLIEEAEAFFDRVSGLSWLAASPATETHYLYGPLVYLRRKPVLTVTSVTAAYAFIGSDPETLTVDEGYDLYDLAGGVLRLSEAYVGYTATVVYTHANPLTLPAEVRHHATELVAHWLRKGTGGDSTDYESVSVGGDVSVRFRSDVTKDAPEDVLRFLRSLRGLVFA